jgi:hypothetical protein
MNEDYKELVEYLDEKFTKIEQDIEKKADREASDKILVSQDVIITKLDKLLQEKTMGDEQDKRKKRAFEIHNSALKRGNILSAEEVAEIDKLHV